MNFLKKTANAIGNGIELESLKSERAKLNKEIEKLQSKCDTFNQQITLKNNMNEFINQVNLSLDTLIEFEKINSTQINLTKPVEQPKSVQQTQKNSAKKEAEESDDETDVVVELEEDPDLDPDSFDSIQKNLHIVLNKNQEYIKSLNKNREDFKILVDKLNLILADGFEKYKAEILKKQARVDKINDRLKVLRGKK
jgi:hypothetical protein